MNIIMTGGGESEHFHQIDQYFSPLMNQNSNLLFIPVAGDRCLWEDSLERIKDVFQTINFNRVDMCTDLAQLDWSQLKHY